jgi:hypothetical protein
MIWNKKEELLFSLSVLLLFMETIELMLLILLGIKILEERLREL